MLRPVRLVLPVRAAVPALDLRPGDAVLLDTGRSDALWRMRWDGGARVVTPIGDWAYGALAGALADGDVSPPDDADAPLADPPPPAQQPAPHRAAPALRLVRGARLP